MDQNIQTGSFDGDGNHIKSGIVRSNSRGGLSVVQDSVKGDLPEFTLQCEDDYESWYVSEKHNNEEYDYWYVIRLRDLDELEKYGGDFEHNDKYQAVLMVSSPECLGEEKIRNQVLPCMGHIQCDSYNSKEMAVFVADYGCSAVLGSYTSNTEKDAVDQARKECIGAEILFGFYMDAPQNRIGNTGWDLLKGNIGWEYAHRDNENETTREDK